MLNKLAGIVVLSLSASVTYANTCTIDLTVSPSMQYSQKEISISKQCKQVTLTLKNTSSFAKNVMGHNVVISKTSDITGVATDGMAAGLDNNYVKKNDTRVIAYTNVIGGGETASITVDASKLKANESYSFFCSFPGHSGVMNGTVKVI
jgi:azurin